MKESAAAIFPRYYDNRQSASAVRYVAEVDPMLLADGTYYVLEVDGELVACGGWSRRNRLYTGSGESEGDNELLDPATGRRTYGRCSSATTGHDAASAGASSRSARPRPAARVSGDSRSWPHCPAYRYIAPAASSDRGTRASSPRRRQDPLRLDGEVDRPWGVPGLSDRRVAFPNGARLSPPRPPTALKSAIPLHPFHDYRTVANALRDGSGRPVGGECRAGERRPGRRQRA